MSNTVKLNDGTTYTLNDGSDPRHLKLSLPSKDAASAAYAKFTDDNLSYYEILTDGVVSGKYQGMTLKKFTDWANNEVIAYLEETSEKLLKDVQEEQEDQKKR